MKPWPGRNVTPHRSRDELKLFPLELCWLFGHRRLSLTYPSPSALPVASFALGGARCALPCEARGPFVLFPFLSEYQDNVNKEWLGDGAWVGERIACRRGGTGAIPTIH